MISQKRSKRKPSGGRYKVVKTTRLKKKCNMGRLPTHTKVGEERKKIERVRGSNLKFRLFETQKANLFDPKSKSYSQVKISSVADNPASRHFTRRNIITKGAIIVTEKGKAKVTSRPGQHGTVNAILIE
ncbi:MAG: 30S ribosomal protein S8e [Candidatus Woesearchaeota archaeon]